MGKVEFAPSSQDIVITETQIEGLIIFEKKLYPDQRGWFQESYRAGDIARFLHVPELIVEQGNQSLSLPGVFRGIHAEPQYKIITPLTGEIFIAIVDLRPESATFKKVETFKFDYTGENFWLPRKTLVLSPGLGNSFLVLGNEPVLYNYAVSSTYNPDVPKRSVSWNDPDLAIPWPKQPTIISSEDVKNPSLRKLFPEKFT